MNKYMIYHNSKRCIGCHGCEVHCKVNKKLPVGPYLCELDRSAMVNVKSVTKTAFSFRSCYHCDDPFCMHVCPTGAIVKRDDGIVYINQEKCIGCMACAGSCPWTIPQLNPETKKAIKCDYCMDRVDQGLKPACVAKCATHALIFARLEEV